MCSRGVFFHFFSIQNTHLEDSGSEIDLDDASTDQVRVTTESRGSSSCDGGMVFCLPTFDVYTLR